MKIEIQLTQENAKCSLSQHNIFNLPPQILPYFRTISSLYLPLWFVSGSQQIFLPTDSKVSIFGLPSDIFFWSVQFDFLLGWTSDRHTLPALLINFIFPALPGFQCAFDLCYHNKQVLQTLHLQSVLRELSHSNYLNFWSILGFLLGDFSCFSYYNNRASFH